MKMNFMELIRYTVYIFTWITTTLKRTLALVGWIIATQVLSMIFNIMLAGGLGAFLVVVLIYFYKKHGLMEAKEWMAEKKRIAEEPDLTQRY